MESSSKDQINGEVSNDSQDVSEDIRGSQLRNDALLAELECLRASYEKLRSKSVAMEDNMIVLQQQKDEALNDNLLLLKDIEEISRERDTFRDEFHILEISASQSRDELVRQRDEELREKVDLQNEVESSREKILELLEEKTKRGSVISKSFDLLRLVKECLTSIIDKIDEEKSEAFINEDEPITEESDLDEESKGFLIETMLVHRLVMSAELSLAKYEEINRKEKRELENSVVSLTEENRDINSLLRIALVEKEAVEKTLSRLKGSGEQKRVPLLQIAERGLQKVGFGFMMGNSAGDSSDNSASNTCSKSDSSECEEEVVSLASTVEKIMKNLRLEITQLRRSLDESRSDAERLQILTEKQAQKIAESTLYIRELEERETMLAQNVEDIMMELTEAEEDAARWREACELEVEAGKNTIEERDREDAILREELEKTKASLELSNNKLKLKEEVAVAAMAAQAAVERSLQLADSRASGFRERIEELTKQLEEADSRVERNIRRRVRHICWPCRTLRLNPGSIRTRTPNMRWLIPEMEAILR